MACYPSSVLYELVPSFPEVALNGVCLSTQQSLTELRPVPLTMPGTTQTKHIALREIMAQLGRRALSLPKSAFSSTFLEKDGSTEQLQMPVFLHHVLPQCSDHSALSTLCVCSTEERHSSLLHC